MSSVTRPKGPLPPRVYWTRRLLVLGVALALVFGVGQLVGGQPGDDSNRPAARPAAAEPKSAGPTASPSATSTAAASKPAEASKAAKAPKAPDQKRKRKARKPTPTPTPLAEPSGVCADSDILVTPSIDKAVAGQDVTITLNLTTRESLACHWQASAETVVLKLTSGNDRIWSTQDCPAALPNQAVVVRKGLLTKVNVVWSGQRSDDECSRTTSWAQPGFYHAAAAALGAEPADVQFELESPPRPTITPSPKAKPKKKPGNG